MSSRTVEFENSQGATLAGSLELPDSGAPSAFALFAHCFTCTRNFRASHNISRALAAEGLGVLRFDFTGLGESEGEFAATTFSSNVGDLVAAAGYLEAEHAAPKLLVGHSLGGTAVLQAATAIPSSVAVATLNAPASAKHVLRLLGDQRERIERDGEADVLLGDRPFRIRRTFIEDLERHALPESVRELRKALLILHSPLDDIVDIDNASRLFQHALHPKSFVSLDKADHLLSHDEDSRYAGAVLAAWASRYLGAEPAPAAALRAEGGVVLARTRAGAFRTEISANGHALVADEPAEYGGAGAGPTPYDLLSAALAACTSMTVRMYAEHKKFPLEAVTTAVRHSKIHAIDCRTCETKEGKIDRFERSLELAGDLTGEQREKMLAIAEKCPVHRSLHSEVSIETKLENPGDH
ncbi:MAG TPA: alpha/beta fold hydrolase [Gammaproteobacteria bacterium]|nr:alpha/beta fold hydrolase [Gammaproteobacteria bacterium]